MSEPQPDSPSAIHERRRAIRPYLERIDPGPEKKSGAEPANRIPVENRFIELNTWEWSVLSRGLQQGVDEEATEVPIDGWPRRLAECVAFQARYLTHLSRIEDEPPLAPRELAALRAELLTDAAVGLALQEELQRDVDNLVAVGNLDDAKKLTSFRHKIGQSVGRLKEIVGEEGFRAAEARAAEMVLPAPKQPRLRRAVGSGEADELPQQYRREMAYGPVRHLEAVPKNRVKPLLLVLAAVAIVGGIVWGATRGVEGPPPVPEEIFLQIEGVRKVAVRPPSLFVTVDADRWQELSSSKRKEMVNKVGEIASRSGYQGAHFRTRDGAAVAQWLRKTGVRLLGESTAAAGGGS